MKKFNFKSIFKFNLKKYPLLICAIVSCAIIVASLFVLGFCGINLSPSLGGGSQFEISLSNEANSKTVLSDVKSVLKKYNLSVDSSFVEDKYEAGTENGPGQLTTRCLVVKLVQKNISAEKQAQLKTDLATKLSVSETSISAIENITSSVTSKNVLFIGLAVLVVAVCLFIYGWVRFGIWGGTSFVIAFLHNIIVVLALVIVTRLPLSLAGVAVSIVLTFVMTAGLITIFEKNKTLSVELKDEKQTISQILFRAEKESLMPFAIIGAGILVLIIALLCVPVLSVKFTALIILIAFIVSIYSLILVGPAIYSSLMELKDVKLKAILSRNHKVNKTIQKKIKSKTSK